MERLPVYILAGGKSSRFGRDKARQEADGEPMLVRVARTLQPVASSIVVVAESAGKYRDLGFETIADRRPGLGPLGGLQAALYHNRRGGWLLCASCDRIGIRSEWLQMLLDARRQGAMAVVFRDRIWQPLPALYHDSFTAEVDAAIEAGRLAPWQLLQQTRAIGLEPPEDWDSSVDVNRQAQLSFLPTTGGGSWREK